MSKTVVVSMARLRRAWLDTSRTVPQIADDLGLKLRTVQHIAKREGWPPRIRRNRRAKLTIELIRPLWEAGLSCRDIGTAVGATKNAVSLFAYRYGLRRGNSWRPQITLTEWQEAQIAAQMRADARELKRLAAQRQRSDQAFLRSAA